MAIYIFNLFSIFFYSMIFKVIKKDFSSTQKLNKKREIGICFIFGFQLFFISAFRATTVGIDVPNYVSSFYGIKSVSWLNLSNIQWEYLYVALNKAVSSLAGNEYALLFVTSAIIIFPVVKYIIRYSKTPWLSLYLFVSLVFYESTFNLIRQSIAMSIVLLSIEYILKNKFCKFLISVGIAFLFHKTAILFIVLYPLSKIKMSFFKLAIVCATVLVLTLLGGFIMDKIFYIGGFINPRYASYEATRVTGEGYGMLLILFCIVLLGWLFGKSLIINNKIEGLHYLMILIAVMLQALTPHYSYFLRLVVYFSTAMIVFIPNVLFNIKDRGLRFTGTFILCTLATLNYIVLLVGNAHGQVPYRFMWQ